MQRWFLGVGDWIINERGWFDDNRGFNDG